MKTLRTWASILALSFTCSVLTASTFFLESEGGVNGGPLPFNPAPTAPLKQIGPDSYLVEDGTTAGTYSTSTMAMSADGIDPGDTNNVDTNDASDFTNCLCCTYPTNGVLKWVVQVPDQCYLTDPSIGPDGTVYVPVNDEFAITIAIDPTQVPTNGFSYPYNQWTAYSKWNTPGVWGTPVIGNGVMYAAGAPAELSDNGGSPYAFSALSLTDGSVIWTFMGDGFGESTLRYSQGQEIIYVADYHNLYALTNAPGVTNFYSNTNIYAYGLTNVGIKWVYTNLSALDSYFAIYGYPVVSGDGKLYLNGQRIMAAFNADTGALLWTNGPLVVSGYYSYQDNGGGCSIGSDGTIYQARGLCVHALNPDGSKKWENDVQLDPYYEFEQGFNHSVVIGRDNRIYVKCDQTYNGTGKTNELLCLNGADGSTNWIAPLGIITDYQSFNYTVGGEGDIALAVDGEIYVTEDDGTLYSFCPNGQLNWSYATGNLNFTSPVIGTDGSVYLASASDAGPYGCFLWAFQGPAPADCQGWPENQRNNRRTGAVTPAQFSYAHLSNTSAGTNGFQFTINSPQGVSNVTACLCGSTDLVHWGQIADVPLTNGPTNFIDITASNYVNRFYYAFPQ